MPSLRTQPHIGLWATNEQAQPEQFRLASLDVNKQQNFDPQIEVSTELLTEGSRLGQGKGLKIICIIIILYISFRVHLSFKGSLLLLAASGRKYFLMYFQFHLLSLESLQNRGVSNLWAYQTNLLSLPRRQHLWYIDNT